MITTIELLRDELEQKAISQCMQLCGFPSKDTKLKNQNKSPMFLVQTQLTECFAIHESWKNNLQIMLQFRFFDSLCIQNGSFYFPDFIVDCQELNSISSSDIIGFYLYLITLSHPNNLLSNQINSSFREKMSLSEQFYTQAWEHAYLTSAIEWAKTIFLEHAFSWFPPSKDQNYYLSDSFGPGFYGINISSLPQFYSLLEPDKMGVIFTPSNTLSPFNTIIGIRLLTDKPVLLPKTDCKSCLASNQSNSPGCRICKNSYMPSN